MRVNWSRINPKNLKVGQLVKFSSNIVELGYKQGDVALIVKDLSESHASLWSVEILVGEKVLKADYSEFEPL